MSEIEVNNKIYHVLVDQNCVAGFYLCALYRCGFMGKEGIESFIKRIERVKSERRKQMISGMWYRMAEISFSPN
jgi:hypothetical protein